MFIDVAQAGDAQAIAKLVEHPYIRNGALVGQVGKAAPVALFGQHLDQQVEGMRRREQGQQMDPIQLGRAEASVPSAPQGAGQELVHKRIGHMREKFPEQGGRARQRTKRFHAPTATPRKPVRPQKSSPPRFPVGSDKIMVVARRSRTHHPRGSRSDKHLNQIARCDWQLLRQSQVLRNLVDFFK